MSNQTPTCFEETRNMNLTLAIVPYCTANVYLFCRSFCFIFIRVCVCLGIYIYYNSMILYYVCVTLDII
jgi:hypothetical protein